MYLRVANIAIQGSTLASRFLLVFLLARYLEPAQLGLYGLLTVTVGYSLYLLGFDFYIFTTRELVKRQPSDWGGLLTDQAALSGVFYVVFLPLLSLIFVWGLLPWSMALWFFPLLVLEHINQEFGRLLVALSQPLWASIVLFVRQGSWAIGITAVMAISPATRTVDHVFAAWTVGGVLASCVAAWRLHGMGIGGWRNSVDWGWIKKGLKISLPFFLATLAIRGLFTVDRYWLQQLGGLDVVGAYVLFAGICGTLMTFLDAGVFSFTYPSLIKAHHDNDTELFRRGMRNLIWMTCGVALGFIVVSLVLLDPLLAWMNKPFYVTHLELYPWLLAATVLYAFGMIPHYALYAQGLDRPIIASHLASLPLFFIFTWFAAKSLPVLAVPIGLCAAFSCIALWKTWAFYAMTPAALFRSSRNHVAKPGAGTVT